MTMRSLCFAITAVLLAAAPVHAGKKVKTKNPAPVVADWRQTVTSSDMDRLRDWRVSFTKAVSKARETGNGDSIDREGALLDPDAALDGASPPAGSYRCRVIKLGAKSSRMPNYVVYPPYDCQITAEGEVMGFSKTAGMQRPIGLFFNGDTRRMIFLGTMMLGDETRAMEYGRDSARDMAGALERIGPAKWRLVLPWPRFESMLDVIELVPASAETKGAYNPGTVALVSR